MEHLSTAGDAELWRQAAGGRADAFGTLFERHEHAVRSYCHRRTGSLDEAEDLTSIVFLEAWRRRAEVQLHGNSLLPWLFGVAGNVLRHRWRTAARHRAALSRLPVLQVQGDHADGVAARIDDVNGLDRTQRAFRQLKPADQEVLALCVFQELDHAAAAVALGVPVGTVRSRLSRARARLSALVEDTTPAAPEPALRPVRHSSPSPSPSRELS